MGREGDKPPKRRLVDAYLRWLPPFGRVAVGGVLVLECTDPLTVIDVPHFVAQTGHELAGQS